jgi:hypothetical protein
VKKIGLVLVTIMQSGSLCSMELSPCYIYGKTKINVTKGSHYNLDGKVGLIVIENNEQQLLRERYADNWLVGEVAILRCRPLYRHYNSVGSNSDDDDHSCYNNVSKDVYRRRLKSSGIAVVEPLIFKSQYSGEYYYYAEKIGKGRNGYPSGRKYFGDEAIDQASNDLALCYYNVLSAGLQGLSGKKEKSIALSALGTAVDFPREKAALVAVPAIINFIKNNPNAYDCIELLVKKRSELDLYHLLLNFYTKIEK